GKKDGRIHTDSKSKLVTVLLYLNPGWSAAEGRLRLLYNDHDLTRYAAEICPDAGRCLIFKVTPNCWHGHEPYEGERRTIQLNYVASEEARERDLKRHRFSAFLKGLLSRKDEKSPAHQAHVPGRPDPRAPGSARRPTPPSTSRSRLGHRR